MIRIELPDYMIDKNDKIKLNNNYIFKINFSENFYKCISQLENIIPYTYPLLIKDNHIQQNILIVINNKIIHQDQIKNTIMCDGDYIELFTQFAGG